MRVIKLDAIASTNDFLKSLSGSQDLENYTVVTAENQTKGKGQMGAVWVSQPGKNLTMSVLFKDALADIALVYNLNIAVALAVLDALQAFEIPKLSIKWPNDIMSDAKKLGGILIENSIKSDGRIVSVIGIGLNVNQTDFENLPKASAMAVILGRDTDRELLLQTIVGNLQKNVLKLAQETPELVARYKAHLFRKGVPMPFQSASGETFMGIIQGVTESGKLIVLREDDSLSEFDLKEIQLLY